MGSQSDWETMKFSKEILNNLSQETENSLSIQKLAKDLGEINEPNRKDIFNAARKALRIVINEDSSAKKNLIIWFKNELEFNTDRYRK